MKENEADSGRRNFIKSAVVLGVTGTVGGSVVEKVAQAFEPNTQTKTQTKLAYPRKAIGSLAQLKAKGTLHFDYPDGKSPCLLVKTGKACAHGIGPEKDVVAYSILCSHQGCPVTYDSDKSCFKCPCHFSQFDGERGGQVICGQGTRKLPRVELSWDEAKEQFVASGVDGLIYGRQANIV